MSGAVTLQNVSNCSLGAAPPPIQTSTWTGPGHTIDHCLLSSQKELVSLIFTQLYL